MDKEEEENYSQEISADNSVDVVNFMTNNNRPPQRQISLDKFSFADVMHFADFGPKLALNQSNSVQNEGDNSNYYNFNLVNEHNTDEGPSCDINDQNNNINNNDNVVNEVKNMKRKRGRSIKTSEEVESQRMTHIAVERNRRRQMNEHLLVLRSLMPSSYVQRGDQASIVGGAIEFVRELEQLLQCLESQKRRRLYGEMTEPIRNVPDPQQIVQQPYFPTLPIIPNCEDVSNQEDVAENKSFIADIEVKMIGFDAVIKVLSRRRAEQLVKIVEALEDMQFDIVHTNITTIDQTVLYSFNVKIAGEARCTAEYIANSVHQILSFIDTSTI